MTIQERKLGRTRAPHWIALFAICLTASCQGCDSGSSTTQSDSAAVEGQEPSGILGADADGAIDALLTATAGLDDAGVDAFDGTTLSTDVVNQLSAACRAVIDGGQYRTARRYRDWTVIGPTQDGVAEAVVHIAPVRNSRLNNPSNLDRPRVAAVFKISHNLMTTPAHVYQRAGRGCIQVWRDGTDFRGLAVSYDNGVTPFLLTIDVRSEPGQERDGAKLHFSHDPGDVDFTRDNFVPGAGDHGGAHACFTCMSTGWCETNGPDI